MPKNRNQKLSSEEPEGPWTRSESRLEDRTASRRLSSLPSLIQLLEAVDAFVLASGGAAAIADEGLAFPRGEQQERPDLERDGPDVFDRKPSSTGKRPDCHNSVIVEWRAYEITSDVSVAERARFVQQEIERATAAANKLCTDSECPDAVVTVTYSCPEWKSNPRHGNYFYNDEYILKVTIQLEVKCRRLV